MTITRINENTLMLELLNEEMPKLEENELLYYVLDVALTAEKLSTTGCAFLLESTKSLKGMVFLLTVRDTRKRFKIKRKNNYTIHSFDTLDNFINCVTALHKSDYSLPESSTYTMNEKYYLCFNGETPLSANVLMSEYGELVPQSKRYISHLKEFGNLLTARNSVSLIGKSFS